MAFHLFKKDAVWLYISVKYFWSSMKDKLIIKKCLLTNTYIRKLFGVFFVGTFWLIHANAHEFWISPNKYWFSPYENGYLRFSVGEDYNGENWTGNIEKVQQLVHYLPDGRTLNLDNNLSTNKGDSVRLNDLREGTQMIIYHSKNAFISLEADKFLEYLKEDGLQYAINYRKANKEDSLPGKEFYQRSVKTIFQVGDFKNDICTKPTTLPLDIVPKKNPLNVGGKSQLRMSFSVYFKGVPVEGIVVKIWHKTPTGTTTKIEVLTDKKGRIEVPVETNGTWMVSCVQMVRTVNNTVADWQSYWGSATWSYDGKN
jgi:uncharacterized GH25 family protein